MISTEEIDRISQGWVEEFSVDPYVLRQREMHFWHQFDRLINDQPLDALSVFERVAELDLTNWTFEGLAAGPLRTFFMLYGDHYDDKLSAIARRNSAFEELWDLSAEGL